MMKIVTIKRDLLLKKRGEIELVTPILESLPLDGDLASILSDAIKDNIYKENENDERIDKEWNRAIDNIESIETGVTD